MTVMAEYASYQRPQRRPVGAPSVQSAKPAAPSYQQGQPPVSPTHYHSRTASSAIFSPASPHPSGYSNFPSQGQPQQQQQQQQQQQYPHQHQQQAYVPQPTRRMTNSTVSSTESNPRTQPQQGYLGTQSQTQGMPYRNKSTNSSNTNLRRSTSSRSQASSLGPSSYVALLRKQKATVWCERTQHQDPRIAAQARAAKQRAAHEIMRQNQGRNSIAIPGTGNAASSGGMLGGRKKLHGGKAVVGGGGGGGANLAAGVNVPMRLSASEVGDEGSDDEEGVYTGGGGGVHRRTNSGKSSLTGNGQAAANNRLTAPRTSTRLSYGSSTGKPGSTTGQMPPGEATPPNLEHRGSTGSAGSEERREKEMGDVGELLAPSAAETQESKRISKDELSRRGSVDERTTTMRGAAGAMRLFVANPDASDSD